MKYIRIAPGYLQVKINETLLADLKRAAAEVSSASDEPISVEQYAAEIIESYMASRRLEQQQNELAAVMAMAAGA